jgi:hypothetical protein
MIEFIWGVFIAVARTIVFVLDILVAISDLYDLARGVIGIGRGKSVEVPAEPKIIPPAARRALDEAAQRRFEAALAKN